MVRLLPLMLALVACTGKDPGGPDGADDTAGDDTGYGPNPIVPEAYQYLWDLDASSCEDADAIVYYAFEGGVDADGVFSGREGRYWFFAAEGWEGDCVDTFTVQAEESDTNWQEDPCSGCDREFTGTFELEDADRGCGGFDYEDFFDNDDVRNDKYNVIIMLDPLSPGGNANETTLVMMAFQDDDNQSSYSFAADYARGDFLPLAEGDYEGAATVTWASTSGTCVGFQ